MNAFKSFYNRSSACVRVSGGLSEWFEMSMGMHLGCVMSTRLFHVFMEGVPREISVRWE